MKKIIYTYLLLFAVLIISAQSIAPQVINSAGSHRPLGTTGITISDNVGEPFIQTLVPNSGNFLITQGFLQPDLVAKTGPKLTIIKSDVTCKDKNDGFISTSLSNILNTYTVSYNWLPSILCPLSNCSMLDSLKAGTYSLQVIVLIPKNGSVVIDTLPVQVFVITDINGPCKVKLYNAITPNNDGTNDAFFIENISEFPKNRVTIYNRWGQQLADINGYDNVTKYWPSFDEAANLISTTYFYIIDLGDNNKPIKGWIEVLKD